MSKKKVFLIGPMPPPSGGVSIHLKRLLNSSKDNQLLSLDLFDFKKRKLFFSNGKSAGIVSAIKYFISADIIHLHVSNPNKIILGRISKLFRKEVFFTIHSPRELDHSHTQTMIQLSDKTIFVFKPDRLPGNGIVIPAYIKSTDDIPLPYDLKKILKQFNKIIVSVSSLSSVNEEDIYGFDIILDAISNMNIEKDVALCLIDTTGNLKERYADKIELVQTQKGLKIFFITGDINFSKLLILSAIFVRATRSDGDSLSVREALDLGVPVLASDCTIRPEGCTIFRSGDSNDLKEKIIIMLSNKTRQIFQQEDFSNRLFDLYLENR